MRHIYTTLFILSLMSAASCSDDNKSRPAEPVGEKTFTDASGLELYYNGNPMPGKTVVFAQNGDKATIKAFSTFDLSQISGFGMKGNLPSPGIIPGSPETSLDVSLGNAGEGWEFSGKGENLFCTYNYTGSATPDKLKLIISDAKLKSGGVSPSLWSPAPIKKGGDGNYISLPVYADWEYDPIPEIDLNLSPFLSLLFTAPVIPVYNNTAYMSISEAIHEALKGIAFLPDGNILFTYFSSVGGADHIAQSYPNGYQYIVAAPGMIKLYVNPLSFFSFILQATSGSTPESEVDLNATGLWPAGNNSGESSSSSSLAIHELLESPIVQKILKSVTPQILPMLSEGIPLAYAITTGATDAGGDTNLKVFVDTEMAVKIATAILTPLLEDNETIAALRQQIASDPRLSALIPDIDKAIASLPTALERTTKFNLGLNLIPFSGM